MQRSRDDVASQDITGEDRLVYSNFPYNSRTRSILSITVQSLE